MTGALVLAVLVGAGALVALLVRSAERTLDRSYEVTEEPAPGRRRRSSAPPPGAASAPAEPPWASAAWPTMATPSPEPGMRVVRSGHRARTRLGVSARR